MTKYLVAAIALAFTTSAHAESAINYHVGAERNLDTEINSIYSGVGVSEGSLSIGAEITWKDTVADNAAFNFTQAEIDMGWAVTPHVSVYVNNDFDADFKHEDTVIGAKLNL